LKVVIIGVGRPKGEIAAAIASFEARAKHYWKLETLFVDGGAGRDMSPDRVVQAEGERILARLPAGGEVVIQTRKGKALNSNEFAAYLEKQAIHSVPTVAFVVGGAFGISAAVVARATRKMSLSPLTLPHDLARLVLTEQLYRAGTILRNEPYHKGTAR